MISGAIEQELEIANARAELLLEIKDKDKEIERLNNIINEFDKISYEDWNMWGKYREYIKILSEFADDTQLKLNPYLTDAYKSDIKVAIKVLIRVLKESYTKDKIEELESKIKELKGDSSNE